MVNKEGLYSIRTDYMGVKSLAVIPVGKFNISDKYEVGDITIYPIGSINTDELFETKIDFYFGEVEEDFFNSAFIVFPIDIHKNLPFGNFSLDEKREILNINLTQAEEVINVFKYIYCNLDKTSLLTQKAGYINNIYSGMLIYYPELRNSDFIKEKYRVNSEFVGKGLIVNLNEVKEMLDKYTVILKEDWAPSIILCKWLNPNLADRHD